ncbi:MAG: DUF2911 domain-containing protein [Gemmatimonadetes bacterium]|nr:DUF2911 domain-containing protein [Gemmatimonadota bacterium]
MKARFLIAALLLTAGGAPVAGQSTDTALYVVRLGVDTVAVERWVRSPDSLHVVAVTRSPRTTVRRYVVHFDGAGSVTGFSTGAAGAEVTPTGGAVPIAGGTFAPYALAVWQGMRASTSAITVAMMAGGAVRDVVVQQRADNEYTLPNQFGAPLSVYVDERGGITAIDAGGGSTVERVPPFDFEMLTREFAERDRDGTGLGPLSPRDTARATLGGGTVMIDYSRPSARGRTVMGGLVPWDDVWRTGANDATQLITDVALRIGDVRVPPGSYSLFTVPRRGAWDLIINRQTGMSGLQRDPAQDVGRMPMQPAAEASHTEQFTIRVEGAGTDARLRIMWGDADVSVRIRADP